MKIISKIFQLIILPIILAGAFFAWSLPRITTDYNFNADELIYLGRSNYWDAYKSGDFGNPIWSSWEVYDQPQLTNYIYAQIAGDRHLLANSNSPCTSNNTSHYNTWGCLDGVPLTSWPSSTQNLQVFVTRARTLATAISSLVIATTYYLGLLVAGPVTGLLAALYLGVFTFFRSLSTMAMQDQTLLLFLNLQFILTLLLIRRSRPNLPLFLALGVVTGLAFSAKLSALFPSLIVYGYLTLTSISKKTLQLSHLVVSSATALLVFFALHPLLWHNPIDGISQMYSWRTTQITNQAGSPYQLTSAIERVIYSSSELFPSLALAMVALASALLLLKSSPTFSMLGLINLFTFVMLIPLRWNRYLLPVMPIVSVYLGYAPQILQLMLRQIKNNFLLIKQFAVGALVSTILLGLIIFLPTGSYLASLILLLTLFLTLQGYLVTRAMLYGISRVGSHALPTHSPTHTFSLIVPARDEAEVIGHTIHSLADLNYPQSKFEVLLMIRADDTATISAANAAIEKTISNNIRIIPIDGEAYNKAYSLNLALHLAKHNIVGIFDAEDDSHPDILARVNDYLLSHADHPAVQAPVHLTNLTSSWYAGLSAVEYYYWFASVLPYLASKNIVPLGGNTIFIKKDVYARIGAYDEQCLTEDADLGIRLAVNNIPVGVLTDPSLATREEVPPSEFEVIRQRARWDQGYLQVLDKNLWQNLPFRQKIFAVYTLSQPLFRHLSFLNMIFSPLIASLGSVPIWVALLSFIPGYFLFMQLGLYILGLSALSRLHHIKMSIGRYILTLLAFVPYQALLALGTLRALARLFAGRFNWDKTSHTNAHRVSLAILE